jgi:hypothetical protein
MVLGLLSSASAADILYVNITMTNTTTRNGLYVLGKVDLSL